MPTVDPNDVIWIQDAMKESGKSREWFDRRIEERRLSVVKVIGENKVYLLRSEINELHLPFIKQPREEHTA